MWMTFLHSKGCASSGSVMRPESARCLLQNRGLQVPQKLTPSRGIPNRGLAGNPLEAALRGIDAALERYEQRPSKTRKVNSLAYCAQEVLAAAEDMKEAAIGVAHEERAGEARGFQSAEIVTFLRRNAAELDAAKLPLGNGISAQRLAQEIALTLRELATDLEKTKLATRLEDLERRLTVMEDKLFAVLLTITSDDEIVAVRAKADRELVPYRRKMPGVQIEQH